MSEAGIYEQPSALFARCAAAIRSFANDVGIIFPDCACTLLMNASSWPHAAVVLPAPIDACAAVSEAKRLVWVPCGSDDPLTVPAKFVSCAAGPFTWTMNAAVIPLPEASVAVHVTVVAPIGNVLPEAGTQLSEATASSGSLAETV